MRQNFLLKTTFVKNQKSRNKQVNYTEIFDTLHKNFEKTKDVSAFKMETSKRKLDTSCSGNKDIKFFKKETPSIFDPALTKNRLASPNCINLLGAIKRHLNSCNKLEFEKARDIVCVPTNFQTSSELEYYTLIFGTFLGALLFSKFVNLLDVLDLSKLPLVSRSFYYAFAPHTLIQKPNTSLLNWPFNRLSTVFVNENTTETTSSIPLQIFTIKTICRQSVNLANIAKAVDIVKIKVPHKDAQIVLKEEMDDGCIYLQESDCRSTLSIRLPEETCILKVSLTPESSSISVLVDKKLRKLILKIKNVNTPSVCTLDFLVSKNASSFEFLEYLYINVSGSSTCDFMISPIDQVYLPNLKVLSIKGQNCKFSKNPEKSFFVNAPKLLEFKSPGFFPHEFLLSPLFGSLRILRLEILSFSQIEEWKRVLDQLKYVSKIYVTFPEMKITNKALA